MSLMDLRPGILEISSIEGQIFASFLKFISHHIIDNFLFGKGIKLNKFMNKLRFKGDLFILSSSFVIFMKVKHISFIYFYKCDDARVKTNSLASFRD